VIIVVRRLRSEAVVYGNSGGISFLIFALLFQSCVGISSVGLFWRSLLRETLAESLRLVATRIP
jgi:hypothetical protein